MRIIAFSDIHGKQNKLLTEWFDNNPADLLIFGGDLQANSSDDYGYGFMEWLHRLPYSTKVLIFGNHDGYYSNAMFYTRDKGYTDIVFLHDESVTINGINIFGSPHSLVYGNWWFMMKDSDLEEVWKKIPDNTNILITHAGPYGILDYTCDGFTTGSKSLLKRVQELKQLKYHIFGHIHESFGVKTISGVTFMNVSLLNEKYQFTNNPVTFEYETGTTEIDYNVGE
jgi:Icc-related predicted phosphoesterase